MKNKIVAEEITERILADDWTEYDVIKERQGLSADIVDFSKRWELIFIEKLIFSHLPDLTMDDVVIAVYDYGKHITGEVHRAKVIQDVVDVLVNLKGDKE